MSLFDSASLVVTPNGYKEDKLYSIKPSDGSGDLIVTRATTATRVNSDGLIEQVPVNLLTYSDDYTNAAWTKQNTTITANAIDSPTGTLTADKLIITGSGVTAIYEEVITTSGNYYTTSVYAKKAETQYVNLGFIYSAGIYAGTQFDLNNGTVKRNNSSSYTGLSSTITSVGNGWYRLTVTCIINTATAYPTILPSNAEWTSGEPRQNLTGNNTTGAYFWGFQLVTGTSAKEYFPTTDRLDVPRLDYTNSSCPSILVEPQRTNLITYSEQFDDASWTKSSSTITANTSIAPTGNATADTLTITSGGYLLKQVVGYSAVSGQSITISIFAKNQTTDFLIFGGATAAGIDVYTIQDYGNGWYRHTRTRTFTTTATTTIQFAINQIGTHIIWGAQLEAGSYATSYIPTVASSVTRNADVISKTGISSLIGQTEGTIFLDAVVTKDGAGYYPLGTLIGATSSIYIGINTFITSGNIYAEVRNTTQQALITSSVSSGRCKIALAYKSNDIALYINGNLIGTDTSATIPATSAFSFEYDVNIANRNKKNFNTVALWKERLSNETLATLTTI